MGHIANYDSNCVFASSPLSQQRAKECSEISKARISEGTQVYIQATYRKQMTAEFLQQSDSRVSRRKTSGIHVLQFLSEVDTYCFGFFSSCGHFSKMATGKAAHTEKNIRVCVPPPFLVSCFCNPHMWKSRMD